MTHQVKSPRSHTVTIACDRIAMQTWLTAHGLGRATIALGGDDGSAIGETIEGGKTLVARFIHSKPGDRQYHASTAWLAE